MKKLYILLTKFLINPIVKGHIHSIQGLENIPLKGGFIVASNHNNSFDHYLILFLLGERMKDARFIGAKDELKTQLTTPLLYYLTDTIVVKRNNENSKKEMMQRAIDHLQKGNIIVIYPEGNFSLRSRLLRAKTGIANMVFKSGMPVLPVGVKGLPENPKKRIVKIGKPIFFEEEIARTKDMDSSSQEYYSFRRGVTDRIMGEISLLCDKPYPKE
ncbi:MAG TPA: lysophospholipid acyltransferase family protein [Candidatus Pacearchaeota archaeon]|nr:lysophospholipid acyltransferase family protein [Candidatus Pacearchaeota archaeon]HPM08505.1 lysophospholipid acyltransferase family protein [Candidatus Pacearchaeota archaeon]HQI74609.1 lysophospholipid acyltransferase family protein [Candidatus Pacearchaeota archaeon]